MTWGLGLAWAPGQNPAGPPPHRPHSCVRACVQGGAAALAGGPDSGWGLPIGALVLGLRHLGLSGFELGECMAGERLLGIFSLLKNFRMEVQFPPLSPSCSGAPFRSSRLPLLPSLARRPSGLPALALHLPAC